MEQTTLTAFCNCCDPQQALILRPDLGTTETGDAKYALCIGKKPPSVYELKEDKYEKTELVFADGKIQTGKEEPPSPGQILTEEQEEEKPKRKPGERVRLDKDEFYS